MSLSVAAGAATDEVCHQIDAIFRRAIAPDPSMLVWQWAEAFRDLPADEPEPGRKSYDRTPYLREIAAALSMQEPWEFVILIKGSQIGATDLAADWYGHTIHLAPTKIISIWPSVEFAQRKSRELIDPLIESTPVLRRLIAPPRSKDAQNTILIKRFPGGRLVMTGANSALGMRSTSSPKIHLDELDSFEQVAGKEGDPVRLAMRATQNFKGRRKIFIASTPLDEATSLTSREVRRADVVKDCHLPCPHCDLFQSLKWTQMKWETRGAGESLTVHDVHYQCEGCKGKIYNHHKDAMLPRHRWVERWNTGGKRAIAFAISALYSPVGWYSWEDAALEWVHCKGNPNEEKVFWNTKLGLAWNDPAEAPPWEPLYARREPYHEGVVQPGCVFLTMAIDIQQDRIEIEVKGWGRGTRSWSLLYRQVIGDPMGDDVWAEADRILATDFPAVGGDGELPIFCCCVDAGKYPERAYKWARSHIQPLFTSTGWMKVAEPRTVIAIRGRDEWIRTLLIASKVSAEELKRGLKVVGVGVSKLKKELYRSLRQSLRADGSEPDNYRHWPQSYEPAFFKGLVSERLVVKIVAGKPKEQWDETQARGNEPLDLDNYNRAAAAAVGIDRMSEEDWTDVEATLPPSLRDATRSVPPASSATEEVSHAVASPSEGPTAETEIVTGPSATFVPARPAVGPETPPSPPSPPSMPPGLPVNARASKWAGRTRIGGSF